MTIYDLVFEDEQQDIYNLLLNPPKTVIDPLQNGISAENQVSFLCHVKRGSVENSALVSYEYVQFSGYFSKKDLQSVSSAYFHCHFILRREQRSRKCYANRKI